MAIIWIEGFEGIGTLGNDPDLSHKYNNITNMTGLDADLVAGRTGGLAVKCGNVSDTSRFQTPNFGDKTTVIIGLQWKPGTSWGTLGNRVFSLRVGTTETMGVWYKTDGNLEVRRGSTILATTTGAPVTLDTWHLIEFKTTIDNTTGSYTLKVNGAIELTATGVDTQETGDAFVNGCRFFGVFGATVARQFTLDDIYILDNTGIKNNNFIGEQKVVVMFPDADGSSSDFTPSAGDNFAAIDENPRDDDTTHVESATSTHVDLNSFADQTLNQIIGVQINTVARFDTGAADIKLKTKSGATTDTGPSEAAAASYANHYRILEDDPNTSNNWTETNLNASEFGFEVG